MTYDDLRSIYQELILDHGKKPRNFYEPKDFTRKSAGYNPVCGDQLVIYLHMQDQNTLKTCTFTGHGCAICIASASIMTEMVQGRSREQTLQLIKTIKDLATGAIDHISDDIDEDDATRLMALSGVRSFPSRVKCATLAWHTLQAALDGIEDVTTE